MTNWFRSSVVNHFLKGNYHGLSHYPDEESCLQIGLILLESCSSNGVVFTHIYFLEIGVMKFQKWGLYHAHILITLDQDYKPRCAQGIPNAFSDPVAYQSVTKHMLYGPRSIGVDYTACSIGVYYAPYMEGSTCTKH